MKLKNSKLKKLTESKDQQNKIHGENRKKIWTE